MSGKTLLVLFVAFSLFTSIGTAFADDDKKKKTFEEMCAKKKGNSPDALFCQAILGLQQSTNSFFDIFTELKLVDTNLQNQIDSFFDIFVELDDVANNQCPQGQVATGTNIDGSLLCTDITQNQDCDDGFYMSGIDADGKIKCKSLSSGPSLVCGDGIITSPEQCDDANTVSGDGCSATCSVEEAQCTDGQSLPGSCLTSYVGICQFGTNSCIEGQIICSPTVYPGTNEEICSDGLDNDCDGQADEPVCTSSANTCGDGTVTAPETCDDNNVNPGDGCNASCQVESGFSCVGSPSVCVDNVPGVYSVNPTIDYQCADIGLGPFVNINTSQLVVTHDVSTNDVTVSGLPVTLDGSATSSGFSASGAIPGDCTETYQLDATFTDTNTFSGTLSLSFSGSSCLDCTNQEFLVTGTRNN